LTRRATKFAVQLSSSVNDWSAKACRTENIPNDTAARSALASVICDDGTFRFEPDAQPEQVVYKTDRCKHLNDWLGGLDDFRNWLIREAA